jgi:hypothetical protein
VSYILYFPLKSFNPNSKTKSYYTPQRRATVHINKKLKSVEKWKSMFK